jgi:peptidoglycan/xylan/chitin deacetylase (PgdA/CDA1 family)
LDAALGENTEKKLTLMMKADDKSLEGLLGFSVQGDDLTLYFPQGTEEFSAKAVEKASLIDPDKPMIALTFDDGPGGYSKELADLFAEYGGHATFFVLGSLVPNYEEELKYVYEMGNEVGSHTYSHKNLNIHSESTIQSELEKTRQAIHDAIGADPTVIRTPYGNANSKVMKYIDGPVILWSVDSEDWKSRDTDTIVKDVLRYAEDGDIILLHEIYGFSFNATKTILKELAKEGYQFVTVSELIKYKGIEPEGKIYSADYQVK